MPVSLLTCPSCATVLRTANPVPAGKTFRCPKCSAAFPAPEEAPAEYDAVPAGPDEPPQRPAPRERPKDYTGRLMLLTLCGATLFVAALVVAVVLIARGYFLPVRSSSGPDDAAAGEQTYAIALAPHPAVGQSVVVRSTGKQVVTERVLDADGKPLRPGERREKGREEEFTETLLAKSGPRPTKFKRVYEKATELTAGNWAPRSFQGRTMLFEWQNDRYRVTPEDKGALPKADLAELTDRAGLETEHSLNGAVTPDRRVKINDTWEVDLRPFAAHLGQDSTFDPKQSKGEARLVRVYARDGRQFGVLDIDLRLMVVGLRGAKVAPSPLEMNVTYDAAIDGSGPAGAMTYSGKLTVRRELDRPGEQGTHEGTLEFSGTEERSPVPAKSGGFSRAPGDGPDRFAVGRPAPLEIFIR